MADEVFFWYSGLAAQPVSAAAHFLACALTAPRNGKIFLLGGYLRPALAIHSPTKSKKLPPRGVPSTGTCSTQPHETEKSSSSGGTFDWHLPNTAPRNQKSFLLGGSPDRHLPNTAPRNKKSFLLGGQQRPDT